MATVLRRPKGPGNHAQATYDARIDETSQWPVIGRASGKTRRQIDRGNRAEGRKMEVWREDTVNIARRRRQIGSDLEPNSGS